LSISDQTGTPTELRGGSGTREPARGGRLRDTLDSKSLRDLAGGLAVLGIFILLMIRFDVAELMALHRVHLKILRIDELMAEIFAFSIFVAWFSYRRWAESAKSAGKLLESQAELEDANERFSLAVAGSSAGLWDWRLRRGETFLSPRFKELLGFSDDEMPNRMAAWQERIHADDKEFAAKAVERHLSEQHPYNIEIRIRTSAETYRWYQVVGQARWDDHGPARMTGSLVDISDRKLAEEDSARSKLVLEAQVAELEDLQSRIEEEAAQAIGLAEQLAQAQAQLDDAVESISEGFALWDKNDVLVMCNGRYRRIYPDLADVIVPGVSFVDFVRAAYERGIFTLDGEDQEEAIADRVARHRTSVSAFEHDLGDGRRIRVSKRRTKSGHMVGIFSDFTERRAAEATIERMALEDALTGLPNRARFYADLEAGLAMVDRTKWRLGVMLLDLDHFKDVNDTLGHAAGDELLRQVAKRLLGCLRKSDSLARLGGDEFAVIVTKAKSPDDVTRLALRITQAIDRPFMIGSSEVHVGTSIGITIYPDDHGTPEQLLRNADLALYRVKEDGRGAHQLYDKQMHLEVQSRRTMEDDLRRGIVEEQFHLVFQPQIALESNELVGAEVLLRWQHPERGDVPASEFIPAAESSRLILKLGDWLFAEVLEVIKDWEAQQGIFVPLSVNLSPLQFKQPGFTEDLKDRLMASGVDPGWLELEITETMTLESGENTATILGNIKALGVGLAIDDFGTGYSSLGRLKELPVDRLKIDQSFVRDILASDVDAAITRAMIQLGHSLGIKVIAEGVETAEQGQFLLKHGCDQAQGYYYSRPLELEAFTSFVSDWSARLDAGNNGRQKVSGQ